MMTHHGSGLHSHEAMATHYCIERTGDPDDGEFKALVESAGLTGMAFKKVWSDWR